MLSKSLYDTVPGSTLPSALTTIVLPLLATPWSVATLPAKSVVKPEILDWSIAASAATSAFEIVLLAAKSPNVGLFKIWDTPSVEFQSEFTWAAGIVGLLSKSSYDTVPGATLPSALTTIVFPALATPWSVATRSSTWSSTYLLDAMSARAAPAVIIAIIETANIPDNFFIFLSFAFIYQNLCHGTSNTHHGIWLFIIHL